MKKLAPRRTAAGRLPGHRGANRTRRVETRKSRLIAAATAAGGSLRDALRLATRLFAAAGGSARGVAATGSPQGRYKVAPGSPQGRHSPPGSHDLGRTGVSS